ncbi:hypothetical protein VitviT2T_008982 [Vitis vinifera]|uniref:Core Histone H2A/H2B/H3 domain-containing protein n=2 Tax=Vitis vinifera TaxID=29760 RepID=D7SN90_VITVI|eukprot:XP_002272312.1 PREDICTED: histone H2B [Vitis vinifera]
MAPKRSGKTRSKVVVKATRKVVQQTVEVTVLASKQKPPREEQGKKISKKDKAPEELQREQVSADEEPPKELPTPVTQEEPPKKEEEKKTTTTQEGREEKKRGRRRRRRTSGRRRKEGGEGYKRYVYRVLKQVHPGLGVSSKAMTVLSGFMNDMFERIAEEAAKLSKYTGKTTLSAREIQGAVKLVLPGELQKHAMAEGTKAVSNYMDYAAAGGHKQ